MRQAVVLLARHDEVARRQAVRLDEDPHRTSVIDDHAASSELARTRTMRSPGGRELVGERRGLRPEGVLESGEPRIVEVTGSSHPRFRI